ncbi:MAG: hypothetical protein V4635_02825 [Bacteroidota bacterium]
MKPLMKDTDVLGQEKRPVILVRRRSSNMVYYILGLLAVAVAIFFLINY